jgi:hypothetical protein
MDNVQVKHYLHQLYSLLESEDISHAELKATLIQLLLSIEHTSISINDRKNIEHITLKLVHMAVISKNEQLYKAVVDRLSFSYFPGISSLKLAKEISGDNININSMKKDVDTPIHNNNHNQSTFPLESVFDKTVDRERLEFIMSPLPKGSNMMCTVQRRKNTLWTSYRLFFESITHSNNGVTCNADTDTKPLRPGLILAARRQKSGLSVQWYMWSHAESKDWKEKNACAKVTRINSTYTGKLLISCEDTIDVNSPSSDNTQSPPSTISNPNEITPSKQYLHDKTSIVVTTQSGDVDRFIHVYAAANIAPLIAEEHSNNDEYEHLMQCVNDIMGESFSSISVSMSKELKKNIICLKSRTPRPLSSLSSGPSSGLSSYSLSGESPKHVITYAVDFGSTGRVKCPSRKNISMINALNSTNGDLSDYFNISPRGHHTSGNATSTATTTSSNTEKGNNNNNNSNNNESILQV